MDLKVLLLAYQRHFSPECSSQILKIMKLIPIMLLIACIHVSARGYSQITLTETNVPLEVVLKKIRQQSGYELVSTSEILNASGRITIKVKNASLQQALAAALKGEKLSYEIIGKTIVIRSTRDNNVPDGAILSLPPPPPLVLHGRVLKRDGQPLSNVSVLIVGTSIGTTTDSAGRFTLRTPGNLPVELEITCVGYQSKRIKVNSEAAISIALEEQVTGLNDVVVVGYGTQKKEILPALSARLGQPILLPGRCPTWQLHCRDCCRA